MRDLSSRRTNECSRECDRRNVALRLHARSWQIRSPSTECDGQSAVDDPDLLNVRRDESWQEPNQGKDERRRLLERQEILRKFPLHERKEIGRASCRERV